MSRRITIPLLAVLALTVLGIVAFRPGARTIAAGRDGEARAEKVTIDRMASLLVCRFRLLDGAELRSRLNNQGMFLKRPWLLTAEVLANPLVADLIRVEVENVSGGDLELFSQDGADPLLYFDVRIKAPSGRPPSFPHAGQSGVKQLGVGYDIDGALVGSKVRLGRGRVAVHGGVVWPHLNTIDGLEPGQYRVTVVCSYFLPTDGRRIEVESDPLTVTVRAEDVRNWRALVAASDRLVPGTVEESTKP